MKFLVVFAAFAAVAFGYPPSTTWTLEELSTALQNPSTDHILVPYLEAALNEMMAALMAGEQLTHITIAMPYVGTYNVNELAAAIENPNTDPAHIPYLEEALNELMHAIHSGSDQQWITVVIPADLPVEPKPEPEPVVVQPEIVPAPVDVPAAAASSPLVQIIVNVKKQEQVADVTPAGVAPVEEYEVAPTPVQVVEEAFYPEHGPIVPIMPVMPSVPELPGFGPMI